jgi:hypothetical protein
MREDESKAQKHEAIHPKDRMLFADVIVRSIESARKSSLPVPRPRNARASRCERIDSGRGIA